MSNRESAVVIPQVLVRATAEGMRLFRNTRGKGWVGKKVDEIPYEKCIATVLVGARRVEYGLHEGASDLIGWRPIVITHEMVGQTIAQFASIECKTLAYKKTTEEQDNWLEQIAQSGGFAAVAREKKDGSLEIVPIEAD